MPKLDKYSKPKSKIHFNSKMTPEVLYKLDEAFLEGHTDNEACLIAGIAPSSLYRYIEKNPSYGDRKEILKQNPIIKARKTVNKAIETNADIALKFLERKKRDEFGIKTELDLTSQGSKIIAFNYLPPTSLEGEVLTDNDNNPDTKTDSKTTPSLPETTGQ